MPTIAGLVADGPPDLLTGLSNAPEPYDLSSLRVVLAGAGEAPESVRETLARRFRLSVFDAQSWMAGDGARGKRAS